MSYVGTGCPQGSVYGDISPDEKILTVIYGQFIVEKKATDHLSRVEKFCKLMITLASSKGWSYQIHDFLIEGAADLEEYLKGFQQVFYKFDQARTKKQLNHFILTGPFADSYERRVQLTQKGRRWRGCEKTEHTLELTIAQGIRIANEQGKNNWGFMSVVALENGVAHRIGFKWQKCHRGKKTVIDSRKRTKSQESHS